MYGPPGLSRVGPRVRPLVDSIAARLDPGWMRRADPAWLERWTPRRFPLAGGDTEVVEFGEGPPLLLLPPLPGWKEAWIACAPHLAARFRVICFDLRSRFAGPPRWEALVEDVAEIARSLARGPALVAGHSLGGALAMRFAREHPAAVRALVLSSAFRRVINPLQGVLPRYVEQPAVLAALRLLPEDEAVRLALALARRRRWVFDPACGPHICGLIVHGVRTIPASLASERVRLALRHGFGHAGELRTPALVVWGEHDTALARAEGEALAAAIPGAARAISPGAGHLHPLSAPEWLAEAITRWADSLPPARG